MKNFNIFWSSLKNLTFRGEGGHEKPVQKRGLPKKGGHGQFVDLMGVLGKNRRVWTVFEGWFDTPMHTILWIKQLKILHEK